MMNKVKKFLQEKGYLVIVLICIVAVVAAGISLVQMQPDEDDVILKSSPSVKPYATANSGISKTPTPTTPTPTPGNQDVSRPVSPAPTQKPNVNITSLSKPIDGEVQVSFALRKLVFNSTLKEWRTHTGMDIAGKSGDTVRATHDGKVASIKIDPRYGLTVILVHAKDSAFQTVYCGLDQLKVAVGDSVDAGDSIGTLGGEIFCEKDQGTHLHFEVIKNGEYADPSGFWSK